MRSFGFVRFALFQYSQYIYIIVILTLGALLMAIEGRRKDTWSLQALYCCFPSRFADIYVEEWDKGEEYDPQ